jgi:SAM-dependent methyltransferase
MSFQESDAEALPFPDETFDAVTRRLGVMFFTDAVKGLSEFRRVLKPGAIAALVAWAGQQDLRALSTVGVLTRYLPAESQSDANPGRTRVESFSKDGTFAEALRPPAFSPCGKRRAQFPSLGPVRWRIAGSLSAAEEGEMCWTASQRHGKQKP